MTIRHFLATLRHNFGSLVLSGLFFAALSFALLIVTEKNFKVQTDFLVVQNQSSAQDIYMVSRANEYIAGTMEEAVSSELFINEAIATGIISKETLPFDRQNRLDAWKKMVNVSRSFQGNILTVEVRDNSRATALKVSDAVNEVLLKKNQLFRSGAPEDVQVRILSGPIDERTPSLSLIFFTAGNGFILGVLVLAVYIGIREAKREELF